MWKRFEVQVLREGLEQTLGPFTLAAAEETVMRLAREAAGRERFYAFVFPVPDDAAERAVGERRL